LRAGRLVAFPTETVYGLGADATNESAVRRIFEVKGRPEAHPLIVHIAAAERLPIWAAGVPDAARRLAERFWPGPLTLILPRGPCVPFVVTGGLETVGLRVPAHPVALDLLRAFGGGVAAPSANRFGRVSPTRAEHVRDDLDDRVDFILDGGSCSVGVESTIVDLSSGDPAILRPGGVTREQLEAVLGRPVPLRHGGPVRAPGQHALHYAPRAEVILVQPSDLARQAAAIQATGRRVVALCRDLDAATLTTHGGVEVIRLPDSLERAAQVLYEALREVDRRGFEVALAALPPEHGVGLAMADRLRRAAGPRP
jgi:L-threonylcarbamoyladenylate synthase